MTFVLNHIAIAIAPDPVVHDAERELARRFVDSPEAACAWLAENKAVWLGALIGDEPALELWVYDRSVQAVLFVRVARDGTEEVRSASDLLRDGEEARAWSGPTGPT